MNSCSKITSDGGAIGEGVERDSRLLWYLDFINNEKADKGKTNKERCEDICRFPWIVNATPRQSKDGQCGPSYDDDISTAKRVR
jgi:hypothetical protein